MEDDTIKYSMMQHYHKYSMKQQYTKLIDWQQQRIFSFLFPLLTTTLNKQHRLYWLVTTIDKERR